MNHPSSCTLWIPLDPCRPPAKNPYLNLLLQKCLRWLQRYVKSSVFSTVFIYFQRKGMGEREEDKHWSVASHMPPTRDLACNQGMCPDWESNRQPFSLQPVTQPTEPHQSGLKSSVFNWEEKDENGNINIQNIAINSYKFCQRSTTKSVWSSWQPRKWFCPELSQLKTLISNLLPRQLYGRL